jgi:uncharacterized protein YkwD
MANQAKAQNAPEAVASPTLCAMAEILLGWSEPSNPREGVVAFLSSYLGLPTPARQAFVTDIETDDDDVIAERLAETIVRHAKAVPNASFGAAMVPLAKADRFSKPKNRVVLVLGDEPVALDPLPRKLPLAGQAPLSGKLRGALENPKVVISDSKGIVTEPPQVPGKAFKGEIRCGDRPGTVRVEILAEQGGGRRMVANFPVVCGKDLPSSIAVAPVAWPSETIAQEKKVLANINAERTEAGLPPLAWDDALAGVARTLSAGLADPAQRAAAGQAVVENLQKAGVATSLLLVNPAQGRSAEEAQDRLLASPALRANAMNPEVNTAGIGVTTVTDKSGLTLTYLAELFVRFLPTVDPAVARKELAAAIAAKRAEAGLPAIPVDPALDEVAQKYAQEMAAAKGSLPEERDAQMLDGLKKTFRTVDMLAGATTAPLQFANDKKILAPGNALGVGLAQGDHPKLGRNTPYVVILIGKAQEPAKGKPAPKTKPATK